MNLIPFVAPTIPEYLEMRIKTNKRKWNSNAMNLAEKTSQEENQFRYNENFTILVIDDSSFIIKVVENLKTRYQRDLEFAKNGMEGLRKYQQNVSQGLLYHLVLCDLQMPVMDGFETIRKIRQIEQENKYPRTYFCAMSSFEDPETINKARNEGMDNYCQKPMRAEVINKLIESRCETIGVQPKVIE